MLRSMYAGISGMKGFQTKLDTIGNNIANVNTFGYKKGRTTFQDMMSQTISGAQGPSADGLLGGKNPSQIGLGSKMGSVDTIHTQGNRQTTNRPLDLAIEGDGMFVLAENLGTDGTVQDSTLSFSRAGNFYLDTEGNIVNSNGQYLVGVDDNDAPTTLNIPATAQSFSVQSNGEVTYVDQNNEAQSAGSVSLANFANPEGLEKIGGNMYRATNNAGAFDVLQDLSAPGENGTGQTVAGALEMSNVDLSEEFTEMITAQRGFQANTRIITTSDEILQELVNLKR
ncbi:flagellar hook protein FlgE [Thalassobacillus cyri]|uniref:Flagellar hook protein FlgE n=1 Tax=Thalassobacillus cyri TaxID=571932 RepID=A0A1H4G2H5_9BACI|nr:flagellar basal body rod protein FlgG [Thalassobacillus cyri]SEB03240.1 flagellar hook protein FlgE [Thalassobacillus cyri]